MYLTFIEIKNNCIWIWQKKKEFNNTMMFLDQTEENINWIENEFNHNTDVENRVYSICFWIFVLMTVLYK